MFASCSILILTKTTIQQVHCLKLTLDLDNPMVFVFAAKNAIYHAQYNVQVLLEHNEMASLLSNSYSRVCFTGERCRFNLGLLDAQANCIQFNLDTIGKDTIPYCVLLEFSRTTSI